MKRMWLLVLYCILLGGYVTSEDDDKESVTICDNGKYKIHEDFKGDEDDCHGNRIVISEFLEPAGETHCSKNKLEGESKCMSHTIHYLTTPPSSGDYRPLAPKYGEYKYIPPQRWVHALKYGAVVFLYHPCAPLEQIMTLKDIAKSCLRKHIITSYPELSINKPLALVTWGCVYSLSWADKDSIQDWINAHALQTSESLVIQDGEYDHGLVQAAKVVSTINDSVLCPLSAMVTIEPPGLGNGPTGQEPNTKIPLNVVATIEPPDLVNGSNHHNGEEPNTKIPPNIIATIEPPGFGEGDEPTTTDNTEPSTSNNCSSEDDDCYQPTNHITVVIFIQHHPLFLSLIILTSILVCCILVSIYCWKRNPKKKQKLGRYKPVSHFFNGRQKVVGIAIPELGVPKAMPSEREKLLLESDEDEL